MRAKIIGVIFTFFYVGISNAQSLKSNGLRDAAPFPIGFAVEPMMVKSDAAFREIILRHADGFTATNAMKPNRISPRKDVYNFQSADYLVDFAKANNRRVHGHTLVWFNEWAPKWMKKIRDSTELESAMKVYIQKVGAHFRGKVVSWDVVNEAFDDRNGSIRQDSLNEKGKTLLNLGKILGRDYVARMFQYAHDADPDALLFYNDYGQETNPAKLKAILAMVADFKKRGIPIHGLGLQMHSNIDTPEYGIENVIRQFAETGLQIHISELDISMNIGKTITFQPTVEQLQMQSQKYKFVVETYRRIVPERQQFGITTWGVGDKDSWIPEFCNCTDFPLLFDEKYQSKKSYDSFIQGLTSK